MNSPASLPLPPGPVSIRKTSVIVQLTLLVVAMMVVLLGGVLSISYVEGRRVLREQIDDRLSAEAESHSAIVRAQVSQLQERIAINSTGGAYRAFLGDLAGGNSGDLNRKYSGEAFARICAGGWALSARLVDAEGKVLISTEAEEVGRSLSGDAAFVEGLAGVYIGQPQATGDRFEARISAPVRTLTPPESVCGVLVLTVDVTPLATALQDRTGLGETGEVMLAAPEGDRIRFLFPRRNRSQLGLVVRADEAPAAAAALAKPHVPQRTRDHRGVPVLVLGREVGHAGWMVVAKIDEREAYAPIGKARNAVLALAGAIGVIGLVGAYLLARGFARPIQRLASAAESVARGDLTVSVPVRSNNELGAMSAAFNEMTGALHARTVERERAEEALDSERTLLRTLIDVLPVSIYVKDMDSRFVVANEACAKTLRAKGPAELLGKTDADFFPPELAKAFLGDELRVLAGESIVNLEERSVRPDGTPSIELTTKVPLRDPDGKIIGLVGVSRDITELKREQEAVRASEELLRSITDNTDDIIFVKDRESRTLFKNPAGLRANALPPEKVIGHTDAEFGADPEQAMKFLANDRRVMETGRTETVEEVLTSAMGEKHVLLTTKTPRFDAQGKVIGLVGIARDITVQKQAEAALRDSEARLRAMGDNIPGGAIYQLLAPVDGPPRYVYMSAGVERLFGIPTELVLSDPGSFWRMIVEEDRPRINAAQEQSAHDLTVFDCEFRQRTARREVKWLHARATPRRLADGAILWDGVVTDITEQKVAEEKLRESNARYELVVTGAFAGIWDWDVLAKRVYYSPRWTEMRGYTDGEVSDREEEWSDGIHPDDRERVLTSLRAHIDGRTPVFSEEYRIRCKDGTWKWVFDRGIALRDAEGHAVRMAGSETDITERKRAEEALHESEDQFRAFMELSPIVAWIKDEEFRVRYANAPFARLFQSSVEKLIGQTDYDYLPPEVAEQTRANDKEVLLSGQMIETIEHVPGRDGRMRHWLVQKFPLVRADKRVWIGGSAVDLTERLKAEEEIRASLHEKEVLLREVHHRVKNNLQIVSSLLNLQRRQLTDPALIEVFSSTRDRVRAMAAVHERLYESGDFAQIDVASHIGSLARVLMRAHAPTGVQVEFALQFEPVTVDLNTAVPLSLIANELIINALKYAFLGRTAGTLTIELRAGSELHTLVVRDDGPGIPVTVDPTTTRSLGLRLVRDLARQIRGELQIDSDATGTKIAIRWPAQLVVSELEPKAAEKDSPEI